MDTKRLILAITLSIVVIIVYQYFFMPKPVRHPVKQEAVKQKVVKKAETQDLNTSDSGNSEKKADNTKDVNDISELFSEEKKQEKKEFNVVKVDKDLKSEEEFEVKIKTDLFTAVFINKGAGLKSFILEKYKDDKGNKLELISKKVNDYRIYPFYFSPFEKDKFYKSINSVKFYYEGEKNVVLNGKNEVNLKFVYSDKQNSILVEKIFKIRNDSYVIDVSYNVVKNGIKMDAPFIFGPDLENNISKERTMQLGLQIGYYDGEDKNSLNFARVKTVKKANLGIEIASGSIGGFNYWVSYETTYFAAMFKTNEKSSVTYNIVKKIKELDKKKKEVLLYSYIVVKNPGAVFLGPKDEEILSGIEEVFKDANVVIEYGWFGSIAKIILKGIVFIYKLVPNYGWAIILFTIFLKIVLFPLTYSSSVSMAKMQTLQPKLKAIKKKYKNQRDPEQRRLMNQEIMDLYKKEKVNPAGGCLPMLLQLPILWGFFRLLAVSINVRHEPWILWIKDLSMKDPIYLLPILMGVSQIVLQKMTPSGGDANQKKMMYIMPVIITIFVLNLPAGLTLYWFASNLLQIGQQHIINKKIYQEKKQEERKKKELKRKKGGKK